MFCRQCGTKNPDTNRVCTQCGAKLHESIQPAPPSAPPVPTGSPPIFYKNPSVAAILSFFWMGLGQIYNGEIGKGIGFIIAYIISCVLIWVGIGLITTPLLWVWGMYDAYQSAKRINREMAAGRR